MKERKKKTNFLDDVDQDQDKVCVVDVIKWCGACDSPTDLNPSAIGRFAFVVVVVPHALNLIIMQSFN